MMEQHNFYFVIALCAAVLTVAIVFFMLQVIAKNVRPRRRSRYITRLQEQHEEQVLTIRNLQDHIDGIQSQFHAQHNTKMIELTRIANKDLGHMQSELIEAYRVLKESRDGQALVKAYEMVGKKGMELLDIISKLRAIAAVE